MGRKNKGKKNTQNNGASASAEESKTLAKAARKDVMDLIKTLLESK